MVAASASKPHAMPGGHRRVALVAMVLVAAYHLVYGALGPQIPVCYGWGFDGCTYGRYATDFPQAVADAHAQSGTATIVHGITRMGPAWVVWAGHQLLGLAATPASVAWGFRLLNLVALLAGLWAFAATTARLGWGARATGVGLVLLLTPWLHLGLWVYNPVATDVVGLACILLLWWGWVANRVWAMLGALVVSSFSWAITPLVALVLLALPYGVQARPLPVGQRWWAWVPALGLGVGAVAALLVLVFALGQDVQYGGVAIRQRWLPLSLVLLAAFYTLGLRALANTEAFYRPMLLLGVVAWGRLAAGVGVLVGLAMVQGAMHPPSAYSLPKYLALILTTGVARPGAFVLGWGMMYGLGAVLWVLRGRAALGQLRALGLGAVAVALPAVLVLAETEGRHHLNWWPLAVLALVPALQVPRWRPWQVVVVAGLALVASKVWYPLGWAAFPGGHISRMAPTAYPYQHYYGHWAMYAADATLLWQGGLLVVCGVVAWVVLRPVWRAAGGPV